MKQLTGNQVRQMFLDYFASKDHMIEPGASLIPHNDPTLLWINAGVAALKKYFDGSLNPEKPRIANAQKSIRTNDIENVGKTARHHTFFEMLGNFSIGDYFKKEAIHFAWEFLTDEKWIAFPKDKLYISVYEDDKEAYRVWSEECGVSPSHILKTKDNFWEIGEGPGGPDSEIFYDRGEAYDPEGLGERLFFEELENDRYIEVWNVVFSQYDCKPELPRSEYKELPQKNIDTGMGLERLVSLIQGGETNFDTDLFLPIIEATKQFAKHPYEGEYKMAYRVIADHIRTVSFALADGALFANEGRGYVLRRVLRRAVRFARKLEIEQAFLYRLVPVVTEIMKDFYPYLTDKQETIMKLVKAEEERFSATLADGERLLMDVMKERKDHMLDGQTAFQLYDTYGFPFELTLEIAGENGYQVDEKGFHAEMEKQRERARNARDQAQSMSSQSADLMSFTQKSEFIGYDQSVCEAKVIALFKDGKAVNELSDCGEVILDQTVCYAESGGQVADCGIMKNEHMKATVEQVIKAPHKQHLHSVVLEGGKLSVNDCVSVAIDEQKRKVITNNHSCTHLLQSALKQVIGTHIQQAGSFVSDEYLRFDFTHFEKVSEKQLKQIEDIVNRYICAGYPVIKEYMAIEEAKKSGATALFDEKYGDIVRVVTMGDVSKEFCGGCHVNNTQEIGLCKIIGEESIGSGIRRITAKSGFGAYLEFTQCEQSLKNIASLLKLNGLHHVEEKVAQVLQETEHMKKELHTLHNQMFVLKAKELIERKQTLNGLDIIIEQLDGADANALKDIASTVKAQLPGAVIFLASKLEDKAIFVAGAGKAAVESGIKCGDLVKEAALICEGKGGGRPDLAQSGAKNTAKINEAINVIKNKLGFTL